MNTHFYIELDSDTNRGPSLERTGRRNCLDCYGNTHVYFEFDPETADSDINRGPLVFITMGILTSDLETVDSGPNRGPCLGRPVRRKLPDYWGILTFTSGWI